MLDVIFITLVVGIGGLFLANFFSYCVLKRFSQKRWTPFLFERITAAQLQQVMPEETEEDIEKIVSSFSFSSSSQGGRFLLTYAPYTEHKDAAFASKFLNVTEQGVRLLDKNAEIKWEDKSLHNVFLFGGSTTLGYGVRDSDTIAAYLSQHLSTSDRRYQVINSGRQSYFSTLEVLAFQSFLQKDVSINTVIFIDGLNDVFHNCPFFRNRSRFSEIMEEKWEQISGQYKQWENESFLQMTAHILKYCYSKMPLTALTQKAIQKISSELRSKSISVNDRMYERWAQGHRMEFVNVEKVASDAANLTNKNWDITRGICQQLGIRPIFVLQPVYYVRMDTNKHLFVLKNEHPKWYEVYRCYYELMIRQNTQKSDFLNLAGLFEHIKKCPFVDSHHYSPYGNRLIAESIGINIKEGQTNSDMCFAVPTPK